MSRIPPDTGRELCEALGLDPNRVTSIVLRWTVNDVPRVRVTLVDLDGHEVVRTVARYRLEPISWSVPVAIERCGDVLEAGQVPAQRCVLTALHAEPHRGPSGMTWA